jgi:hypothetical protein
MDGAVNSASIAIAISMGGSVLAGAFCMFVAMGSREGVAVRRDRTVLVLGGIGAAAEAIRAYYTWLLLAKVAIMPPASRLVPVGFTVSLISLALVASAACRPSSAPEAGSMLSEANEVVVGRVTKIAWPDGRPMAMTDWTTFRQSATINVSAVVKGEADVGARLLVDIRTYHPVALNSFGIFFLNHDSDDAYRNADIDHWVLTAKPFNSARTAHATDPTAAVAQEMLAILATPSAQLGRLAATAMQIGSPDTSPAGLHEMAAWALADIPVAYVVEPLRQLAAGPDQTIRIWATSSLVHHHAYSALQAIVPDLIVPQAEALVAARDLGRKLGAAGLPDSLAPTLIHLLASKVRTLRGNAGYALGGIATQEAVVPLATAIESETDLEAMRREVEGLCRATSTRTPPCDKVGWYGYHIENPPLWRAWAQDQVGKPGK